MLEASIFALRNWENNYASPNRRYHPQIVKFLGYLPKVETKEFYGDRILHYLKSYGMSRTQLASKVGVRPMTIHKWIHNMSTPPDKYLSKLISIIDPQNERKPDR